MAAISSSSPTSSLSLRTYLLVIRRQRRLILIVTVLTSVLAALPAVLADSVYASTAQVRISALDQEGIFETDSTNGRLANDQFIDLANEMEYIRSKSLRTAVEAQFPDEVPEFVDPEVTQIGFSEIVDLKIKAGDPDTAADVANAYAEVFVEDRQNRSVDALVAKADELMTQSADATRELDGIGAQIAAGDVAPNEVANLQVRQATLTAQIQDYNRRADELTVEAALRGRGTEVITPAELELDPISSGPVQGAVLGLVLGALLGLAIAVVADLVQDKLGSKEDLAEVRPDVPVLAAVPHAEPEAAEGAMGFAAQEAYRYLRTGIRVYGLSSPLRSVLITSAVGGEGKTTTAANLALAMAEAGDRVVLVDCDLRRPALHRRFGLSNAKGLTSVVVGDASLDDVTAFVHDNLAVVPAGPAVQNPTEVLGSSQFADVLQAVIDQAEFTILDSPPVLPVADGVIAGQLVDGVIMVSRIGAVRRRSIRELLARLGDARIPLVGFVANDTEDDDQYDYYDPDREAALDKTPVG
jgi:capsular exopolysaccharide synthesis family protein